MCFYKCFLSRLWQIVSRYKEPSRKSCGELLDILQTSHREGVITADVLFILEGAFSLADMTVHDVFLPRSCIKVIDINVSSAETLPMIIESKHSRFPVVDGSLDNILGIFLVKDLLRMLQEPNFHIQSHLRPTIFVPETKSLHHVLRDFRLSHNHMAIVVDEYGAVVGMLTIEDVLECIVGEIDDEFDFDDVSQFISDCGNQRWRVRAITRLDDLNAALDTNFISDDYHTVAGLVTDHAGCLLRRGQFVDIDNIRFHVLHADNRRLYMLEVENLISSENDESA